MFEKFLKRSSWTDIVISIIFVLFGVLLVAKPDETVGAISIILGIVFIAMGVLKLVEYYTSDTKEDWLLTVALITVILGVVILFASDAILSLFRVIVGIWIIATGIMDFQTTLVWKEVKSPYWTVAVLLSILMMLAGIVILINQNILITTMGIIIVVYAVLDIIDRIIFMKKINDYMKK
jgi:putative membrane protein